MEKYRGFKEQLDKELSDIKFGYREKEIVLEKVQTPYGRIKKILEREIIIPVKPAVVGVVIIVISFILVFTNVYKVTDEDVQKSRIIIYEKFDGGHEYGLYKN